MPVKVTYNGLEIDGALRPLYSGSVHYWRHDPQIWPLLLDRVVEMGFKFVCVDVPWSVHETCDGAFDFGEKRPENNLGSFLGLCAHKGLFALARPGPNINADLTFFGFPERVLMRADIMARTAMGTPALVPAPPAFFPAPSYASPALYDETAKWFDAVCPILAKHIHPGGCLVGLQADNEMSFFHRTNPFDLDYSEASVTLYHAFLRKRHGDIEALNRLYGSRHSRFRDIRPPREFRPASIHDLPFYFEWVEYKEFLLYHGIKKIVDMLHERGLRDVFFFHNYPSHPETPFHVPGVEDAAVDVVGINMHTGRGDYLRLRDTANFLAATSRLPFVPELGSGCRFGKTLAPEDQEFACYAAFMHGVKAVNHYMLADRDRWHGAPVARDGRTRERRFHFHVTLNRFLHDTSLHKSRIQTDALLLHVRDYERFESLCSLLGPLPRDVAGALPPDWFTRHPEIQGLGLSPLHLYRRHWRGLRKGFSQAGYPLALGDSDMPLEQLQAFRMVIAPSFAFMNHALQRKLLVYALKGGLLVMGPRAPVFDECLREDSRFSSHLHHPVGEAEEFDYHGMLLQHVQFFDAVQPFMEQDGKVCAYERGMERGGIVFLGFALPEYDTVERAPHAAALAQRLAARAGIKRLFPPDDPIVETTLHTGGRYDILFVNNPTAEKREPRIALSAGRTLTDWHTREKFQSPDPSIALRPYSVRVFIVS